jgi:hypothetical protein
MRVGWCALGLALALASFSQAVGSYLVLRNTVAGESRAKLDASTCYLLLDTRGGAEDDEEEEEGKAKSEEGASLYGKEYTLTITFNVAELKVLQAVKNAAEKLIDHLRKVSGVLR